MYEYGNDTTYKIGNAADMLGTGVGGHQLHCGLSIEFLGNKNKES